MRFVPALVLLATLAVPVSGFTSVPFGGIHGTITREALAGLSPRAIDAVIEGNWRADFDEMTIAIWPGKALFVPNDRYDPGHHFDRGGGEGHGAAFDRGAAFVREMGRETAARLSSGEVRAGLLAMGRAVHALQDFCSHSNVIDLAGPDRAAIAAILAGAAGSAPAGLRITGYDPHTGQDPEGDPFGHDAFSKDGPDRTPEARVRVGERTKHALAVEAAVALTRAFAGEVREAVGEAAWGRLAEE